MPNVRAFRSGNWADTNTTTSPWATGGVLYAPNSTDDVFTNGFTITVDTSVTAASVTNGSATSRLWKDGATTTAASGGGFTLNNEVTLTATCRSFAGNLVNLITLSGTNSATIVGDVFAGNNGGSAAANAILLNSTGTLIVNGSLNAVTSFFTSPGASTALSITSAGTVNITGNLIGASAGNTSNPVITSTAAATITVTGNCEANLGSAISSTAAINLTIVGNCTASNQANAISATNASATIRASGDFIYSSNGTVPIYSPKFILNTTPAAARTRYALNGSGTFVNMFTADNTGLAPAVGDVRAGVVYGSATGTLAVPPANSVAFGVAVDNTTGTAVLTPAAIRAELATELGRIDAAISSRLAPNGTLATVTNLTNAPASVTPADIWDYNSRTLTSAAPPSAVAIRQEMDSNSTKLANLDAAVSSRSTPANIPASDITAIKAKTDALNTDRLAQVSTVSTTGAQLAAALS